MKPAIIITCLFAIYTSNAFAERRDNCKTNLETVNFSTNCCNKERHFFEEAQEIEKFKIEHKSFAREGLEPLIQIAIVDLNGDEYKDFIARIESIVTCGSRGCNTYIYLGGYNNTYEKVSFSIVTHSNIKVSKNSKTKMKNLWLMNDKSSFDVWKWNKISKEYNWSHKCTKILKGN